MFIRNGNFFLIISFLKIVNIDGFIFIYNFFKYQRLNSKIYFVIFCWKYLYKENRVWEQKKGEKVVCIIGSFFGEFLEEKGS